MFLAQLAGIAWDGILKSKYFYAVLTLLLFYTAAKIFVYVTKKFFMRVALKTKTKLDDLILRKTNRPVSFLLLLLGIKLALVPLGIPEKISIIVNEVIITIAILVTTYTVIVILDVIIDVWGKSFAEKTESKTDDNLISITHKFSRFIILILGLLFIFQAWDIQIGPLIASLGIAGIAVAFALQNTLGNIFGGISIIVDRSIRVGDIIKLDEQTSGTVVDVGLRSTRIRTWDNEVIIVPNGDIASSKIKNYVLPDPSARIVVPFSVAYGSDIDKVKKIVMKEIKKLDNLDSKKESMVMFLKMDDSSLNFKAYIYLKSYTQRFFTKDQANTLIYNALNKNKIEIPFPQMDVHLKGHKTGKTIKSKTSVSRTFKKGRKAVDEKEMD
ncbi:MAG: mechanosensitive ion channel family protein [Nanoarchaeota archaeon]|nr:mechanosensitive ion channel family protein [Nanoarchaeota archaeon]